LAESAGYGKHGCDKSSACRPVRDALRQINA